jgi:hypothetical protein
MTHPMLNRASKLKIPAKGRKNLDQMLKQVQHDN